MAAALIPIGAQLLAGVAPEIISLIAGLVHQHAPVLQANSPSPGTGPIRFADLVSLIQGALTRAAQAGSIPAGAIPPDDILKLIIQTGVSALKLPGGVLSDVPSSTPTPATLTPATLTTGGTTWIITGGKLTVQAG